MPIYHPNIAIFVFHNSRISPRPRHKSVWDTEQPLHPQHQLILTQNSVTPVRSISDFNIMTSSLPTLTGLSTC